MKTSTLRPLVFTASLAWAGAIAAETDGSRLLGPTADDLVATALTTRAAAMPSGIERKPLQFAWAIDRASALLPPQPFTTSSREFQATVDAADLTRGHTIHTTQPGALVLISPERGVSARVDPTLLRVIKDGRVLNRQAATEFDASAQQLNDTGAAFSAGTLGMRLNPALGSGRFDLQLPDAEGRYLVQVFEPTSAYALRLTNPHDTRLAGQAFYVDATLLDDRGDAVMHRLSGLLVAPDGRSFPLEFQPQASGGHRLQSTLPAQASDQPGLWELHAFAVGEAQGQPLLRDAKVAIAVAAPTARLAGGYTLRDGAAGLEVAIPLQVAAEGRYEVRAVLYGTDATGELRPAAVAHSANWFKSGQQASLGLAFAPALYAGLSAPFELRQLSLGDQGRQGQLEYRERAMRLSAAQLASARTSP
ncbi:MAG: DUF4785 domain-containing protein [Luteimonas sp.]